MYVLADPTSSGPDPGLTAALQKACEDAADFYLEYARELSAIAAPGYVRRGRTGRMAALNVLDLSILQALHQGMEWDELAEALHMEEQTCRDRYEGRLKQLRGADGTEQGVQSRNT